MVIFMVLKAHPGERAYQCNKCNNPYAILSTQKHKRGRNHTHSNINIIKILSENNIAIMHKQSKWHKAQPRASDEANALLLLSNLGRKHILMARSEAEGPNFLKY